MEDIEALFDSQNGHFIVDSENGRAMLTVHSPGKKGMPVRLTDVLARLELFRVSGFSKNVLEAIVQDADGMPHDVGIFPEPDAIAARVEIELSPDKMQAYAVIHPPVHGGRWVLESELSSAMEAAHIVHGVRAEWKTQALTPVSMDGPIRSLIAQGTPVQMGVPATVEYGVDPRPGLAPAADGETRVDFRKIHVIQTCEEGKILARIFKGEPGHAGVTVTGEVKDPPELLVMRLVAGINTRLSADGSVIEAEKSGHVRLREIEMPGEIRLHFDVDDVLKLETVDFSTGHIDFPGTVIVTGVVADGFDIVASGDVILEKTIGAVHVRAGGSIFLSEGVIGRGAASLQAGGQILSRFVQSAALHAGGSIVIEDAVLHSRLVSGKDISVEQGKGEILGGEAICSGIFRANRIGSRLETPTRIVLGLDPDTLEKLRALDRDIYEKKRILDRVENHLKQLEEARQRRKEVDLDTESKL
ncbi:MAG TPA: FapA family protein, partial [Leptospiraceae bacterium]|nr:FapA family protein [Leptospiraceae bacterium]